MVVAESWTSVLDWECAEHCTNMIEFHEGADVSSAFNHEKLDHLEQSARDAWYCSLDCDPEHLRREARKLHAVLHNRNAKQTVLGFRQPGVELLFQRSFISSAYDRFLWPLRIISCLAMMVTPIAAARAFTDPTAGLWDKAFVLFRISFNALTTWGAYQNFSFRHKSFISNSVLVVHRMLFIIVSCEILFTANVKTMSELRMVTVILPLQSLCLVPTFAEFFVQSWVFTAFVLLSMCIQTYQASVETQLGLAAWSLAVSLVGTVSGLYLNMNRREQWLKQNNVWKQPQRARKSTRMPHFSTGKQDFAFVVERFGADATTPPKPKSSVRAGKKASSLATIYEDSPKLFTEDSGRNEGVQ